MTDMRAVIFANGILPDLEAARRLLQAEGVLFAADAGASHLLHLGLYPVQVVGDLDSIPRQDLLKLKKASTRFRQHPRDKNQTDLELTLNLVLEEGYRRILLVGGLGGRLDMTLGNLNLLARPDLLWLDASMDDGVEQVRFITREAHFEGQPGDIVSLIPWQGPVENVTTSGLRWQLNDERLDLHSTRSVSNELVAVEASIRIGSGLLLGIHRRAFPPESA